MEMAFTVSGQSERFAGYAYGFSNYDSYGFPTSVALGDLEKKDTVKPDPKWKVLCNGSVVGADGSGSAMVTDKPDDAKFPLESCLDLYGFRF